MPVEAGPHLSHDAEAAFADNLQLLEVADTAVLGYLQLIGMVEVRKLRSLPVEGRLRE